MKKILSLLLSVCLVLTMIPAITFAAEDGQASGDGDVIPSESQEEIVGEENPESPGDLEETAPEDVVPGNEEPEDIDEEMPEEPVVEPNPEGEVQLFEDGEPIPDGWQQDASGHYWLYYKNGNYLTSLQTIGGSVYLFNTSGYMQTGRQKFYGKYYYFNPKGTNPGDVGSSFGARMTGKINVSGVGMCYFNPDMKYGMQTIGSDKYYFDKSSGVMKKGWVTDGSNKYYLNSTSGKAAKGWTTVNNSRYYFNTTSCAMYKGFKTISSKKYYFNSTTGRKQTGWATVSGSKYYLDPKSKPESGVVCTKWKNIGGSKYYFDTAGKMKKGWLTIGSAKYYLDTKSGKMKKGWQTISKKKYFFNTSNGKMKKGWMKYKKKKYYLDSKTGVMAKGYKKISGKPYYFKSNGVVQPKGWCNGSKRYSLGGGLLATGTKKIGSTWYVFSKSNGLLQRTIGDDIDKKVQGKSSSTKYLVVVYRAKYQVRIYSGKKNNWTKKYKFDCAIGKASTPTTTGTYYISGKGKMNHYVVDGVKTRYWYYVYYKGKQGIHSGLYYDGGPNDGQDYDTRLNVKSTNGGVRVALNNAQWIYNNVPINTTVVVY